MSNLDVPELDAADTVVGRDRREGESEYVVDITYTDGERVSGPFYATTPEHAYRQVLAMAPRQDDIAEIRVKPFYAFNGPATVFPVQSPPAARPAKRGKDRAGAAQPSGQWIRTEKRLAIYIRDGFACAYCGANLRDAAPVDITLDHLLARSAGGSNNATNLVTACRSCNCSRQDRPWTDYATGGARDRIETLRHRPLNVKLAKAILAGTAGDAALEAAR